MTLSAEPSKTESTQLRENPNRERTNQNIRFYLETILPTLSNVKNMISYLEVCLQELLSTTYKNSPSSHYLEEFWITPVVLLPLPVFSVWSWCHTQLSPDLSRCNYGPNAMPTRGLRKSAHGFGRPCRWNFPSRIKIVLNFSFKFLNTSDDFVPW